MAKHSPLPWRLAPGDNPPDFSRTVDARDCFVFGDNSGPKKADAVLIVAAVNGRKRDEALIASLLYHHLEDFAEAVASDDFTKVVKAAFKRLGVRAGVPESGHEEEGDQMSAFMHIHLHEVAVLGNSHMVCEVKPYNITPGEAAMADAVGKAVKAIDPHALPPFHEEYAVKMHGHIWKGDSEEDFELLKTYDGARKLVERMDAEDVMQGFWDHPAREIVRRVVGEWEDA